jgi:hypothetical protein
LKKSFAILLLATHLFNVFGYKLFFSFAEQMADKQMMASLDQNKYNDNELVQLKVVLNMPYLVNDNSYERCDGQIELNGIQYNYVKRMIKNDTLYLYCIPNHEKTKISNRKNSYAKQNSDNRSGETSSQPVLKEINFFNEYNRNGLTFNFDAYQSSHHQNIISFNNLATLKGFATKHLQPPDLFI